MSKWGNILEQVSPGRMLITLLDALKSRDAEIARLKAEVERLRAFAKRIDQRRYENRQTFHEGNAFEAAKRMNADLIAIYDEARAALTPAQGGEQ